MATHVKVLAILFLVGSALGLITAGVVAIGIGGAAGIVGSAASGEDAATALPIMGFAGSIVILTMLVLSLPGLLAGIGLLKFKPWARILAIVLCALSLLGFPFGTIFGAYGLWVLLTKDTERLFNPGPAPTI